MEPTKDELKSEVLDLKEEVVQLRSGLNEVYLPREEAVEERRKIDQKFRRLQVATFAVLVLLFGYIFWTVFNSSRNSDGQRYICSAYQVWHKNAEAHGYKLEIPPEYIPKHCPDSSRPQVFWRDVLAAAVANVITGGFVLTVWFFGRKRIERLQRKVEK